MGSLLSICLCSGVENLFQLKISNLYSSNYFFIETALEWLTLTHRWRSDFKVSCAMGSGCPTVQTAFLFLGCLSKVLFYSAWLLKYFVEKCLTLWGKKYIKSLEIKMPQITLTGAVWWGGCHPMNRKVISSIFSQGTCLNCEFGPQLGACERQPIDVSLTYPCVSPCLSPSLPLSKNKQNIF